MKKCELCESPAKMYCESDEASLCWDCDAKVHGANFLVAKHSRTLLCHLCQSPTPWNGSGPKLGPTISACNVCVGDSDRMEKGKNGEIMGNDEDDLDGKDENDDKDEDEDEDENDEEDIDDMGDENEDDDEENQVVPWSYPPPPPKLFHGHIRRHLQFQALQQVKIVQGNKLSNGEEVYQNPKQDFL